MTHRTLAAAFLLSTAGLALGQSGFQILAKSGDAAPGTSGGVFATFGQPTITDDGVIYFSCTLDDGMGDPGQALLYRVDDGVFSIIASEGDPAPGRAGDFVGFGLVNPNANGQVVFTAVESSDVTAKGYWLVDPTVPGSLELVAYEETPAPGLPIGTEFDTLNVPFHLGDSGLFAFNAIVSPGTGACFTKTAGSPVSVFLKEGDPVGGTPITPERIADPPTINDNDTVAIFTEYDGSDRRGLLLHGQVGSLSLLAREDGSTPVAGTTYARVFNPSTITNAGVVTFPAELQGAGVTSDNDRVLVQGTPGATSVVLREGDAAPGLAGVEIADFRGTFRNDADQLAIHVVLRGSGVNASNDEAIYTGTPGNLELLVRKGDVLPDLTNGISSLFVEGISPNGRVLLRAGFGSTGGEGYWRSDNEGGFDLLLRDARVIDLDPDPVGEDLRTIRETFMRADSPGNDGAFDSISDDGRAVLRCNFNFPSSANGTSGIVVVETEREPVSLCAADFDGDGVVDLGDFGLFGASFGTSVGDPSYNPDVDLNQDGEVDLGDFGAFGAEFGRTDCLGQGL